ncbi:MAG: hypothetical protein WCE63_08845 [Acidobacteriaceae bacterium]
MRTIADKEKYQIVEYLASPAGAAVFAEIENQPDDYRVSLHIPEPGGRFYVKLPAGSIRSLVHQVMQYCSEKVVQSSNPTARVKRDRGSLVNRLLEESANFARQVDGFKVIDISPAAAQFHATYPDDTRYDIEKTCPNVAPPFSRLFMESGCPTGLDKIGFGRVVVTVVASDFVDASPAISRYFSERPKWTLTITAIAEVNSEIEQMPPILVLYVYASGKLVHGRNDQWIFDRRDLDTGEVNSSQAHHLVPFMMDWFVAPALFAISLMHCKGITLRALANREHHSRKIRRRRKNLPALEHHIIEIKDPQGRVAEGESLTTAIQHGLHIVRGHFSTYTEAAPLFGRIIGTFWIPAHVRGSFSQGVVTSEYLVAPAS